MGSLALKDSVARKEFKSAVKDFDPVPIEAWRGKIDDTPVTVKHEPLNIQGVKGATSVYAEAFLPLWRGEGHYDHHRAWAYNWESIEVMIKGIYFFKRKVPWRNASWDTYVCTLENCTTPGAHCKCTDALAAFKSNCIASGRTCDGCSDKCQVGRECGRCMHFTYLSRFYIVVEEVRPGIFKEDLYMRSAKYDFGPFSHDYQSEAPVSVAVRVYSKKDPYIALQRITQGTNDLGTKDNTAGIVMVVVGAIFLLMGIGVCITLCCYCNGGKQKPRRNSNEEFASPMRMTDVSRNNVDAGNQQLAPQAQLYAQTAPSQAFVYGQPIPQHGYIDLESSPQQLNYAYGQPVPLYSYNGQSQREKYGVSLDESHVEK
ncbi:putative procyclic form surface glycoprotein [Trypanosoma grayi]|uniref:putative procyclic form surface glycoprotein n=1 Tax=Trypanosoma grayi TaxID=71804 RepID=UPI0004F4637C|nr:putative procyclic form surface glycoprotein [Trypanosoma grayi]KEG05869.1 putative procyclic form surface glycoprotein [Trypanosoma grayi]